MPLVAGISRFLFFPFPFSFFFFFFFCSPLHGTVSRSWTFAAAGEGRVKAL
jgi:hypothetical protein